MRWMTRQRILVCGRPYPTYGTQRYQIVRLLLTGAVQRQLAAQTLNPKPYTLYPISYILYPIP